MSVDPEEKLKNLKENLQTKETEYNILTKKKDTLKSDIVVLEKIVSDINQVVKSYNQALQNFEIEIKNIEDYSQIKQPMIDAAIKEKKDMIDSKIKVIDDNIEAIENEVTVLKDKLKNAEIDYKAAKELRNNKQNTFDSLKTLQKKIDGYLKALKNFKDSIEKEEDKNKTANMYFLFSELQVLLSETNSSIITQDTFKSDLYEAWNALDSAEIALRGKDEMFKTSQEEFENKQKELSLLKTNRNQHILSSISNI